MSLVKWCCVYQLVKLCVSEQIENALFKSICQPFDKRPFNRCESNKKKTKLQQCNSIRTVDGGAMRNRQQLTHEVGLE